MDIHISHVSKKFGDHIVLRDLSLHIAHGELAAILGPSGCGKTTLLNIISGVFPPDAGEIAFGDRNMNNVSMERRNVGYVFQDYSLYPHMSAFENISFPLTCHRSRAVSRKEWREFISFETKRIASLLHLETVLKQYPSELSGGQQQRVAIARAIIKQPDVLLLDEPFANLDRKLSVELRDEIAELQKKLGISTLFVTHNQSDANAISNHIILLNEGAIQQEGTSSDLYDHPKNIFAADFFGEYGSNVLSAQSAIKLGLIDTLAHTVSYISFRPENVTVSDNEGVFQVFACTRVGKEWICKATAFDIELTCICRKPYSVGTRINVAVERNNIVCYNNNQQRLEFGEGI